jgi:hypothetical protein
MIKIMGGITEILLNIDGCFDFLKENACDILKTTHYNRI